MGCEISGESSGDFVAMEAEAQRRAREISRMAYDLDSSAYESQEALRLWDEGHDDIPVTPQARILEQHLDGVPIALGFDDTRADQLREAQEITRELGQRMTAERTDSQRQARLRKGIVARTRELEPLLEVAADTFEDAEQSPDSAKIIDQVRPHPATLEVASPSHGQVRISGLARFFPAQTVHARRSTAVVVGDECELKSVDHYHVHRVTVSLGALMEPGSPGHTALQHLLEDPTNREITRFQQSMQDIASPSGQRQTQTRVPVRVRHLTAVTSSEVVQQGPGSRTNLATHYMVEESELPIIDLLADDRGLVRLLAAAATADETRREPATRDFLRSTLRSAGHADDLDLLEHSADLDASDTLLFGLFGVDIVDRASVVMVGSDNLLDQDMKVHRDRISAGTVLDDIGSIQEQTTNECAVQSPEPAAEIHPWTPPWQMPALDDDISNLDAM